MDIADYRHVLFVYPINRGIQGMPHIIIDTTMQEII